MFQSKKSLSLLLAAIMVLSLMPGGLISPLTVSAAVAPGSVYINSDGLGESAVVVSNPIGDAIRLKGYGVADDETQWPEGVTLDSAAFMGGVYDGSGYLWLIPSSANAVVRVDAETGAMDSYLLSTMGISTTAAFLGGVYDGARYIYMIPRTAGSVVKIDTTGDGGGAQVGDMASVVTLSGTSRYGGGALDKNSCIWLAPSASNEVAKIDISDDSVTYYTLPSGVAAAGTTTQKFVGAAYDGDEHVYLIPYSANTVVKVDITDGSMTTVAGVAISNGTSAFIGGVNDGNGNIWMIPNAADSIVKIDTSDDSVTSYAKESASDKYRGGFFDGRYIWLTPQGSGANSHILRIDTMDGSMTKYTQWGDIENYSTTQTFYGGVFDGANGWLLPYGNATRLVRVQPGPELTLALSNTDAVVWQSDGATLTINAETVYQRGDGVAEGTIDKVEWFRVPLVGTAADTTTYTRDTFDAQYASVAAANKGTENAAANTTVSNTFAIDATANGRYWVKITVIDPNGDELTEVKSIDVRSLYQRAAAYVYAVDADHTAETIYSTTLMKGNYGIAYGLDSTTILGRTTDGATVSASKVTLNISHEQITAALGVFWEYDGDMNGTTVELDSSLDLGTFAFKYIKDSDYWTDVTYEAEYGVYSAGTYTKTGELTAGDGFTQPSDISIELGVERTDFSNQVPIIPGYEIMGYYVIDGTYESFFELGTNGEISYTPKTNSMTMIYVYKKPDVSVAIRVVIKDASPLRYLSGISVEVYKGSATASDTYTSNMEGMFTVAGEEGYTYTAEVTGVDGFKDYSFTSEAVTLGTNLLTIYLEIKEKTGVIDILVEDDNGEALPYATVMIYGKEYTTDADGYALFVDLPAPGTHTILTTATGYEAEYRTVSLSSQAYQLVTIALTPSTGTSANCGSIYGSVVDDSTTPIAGVTVTTMLGQTATTDDFGFYVITDVPFGERTVIASASGYNSTFGTVTVAADNAGAQQDFVMDRNTDGGQSGVTEPVKYLIMGRVTDETSGDPLPLATIVLIDGTNTQIVTCDVNGYYAAGYFEGGVDATIMASEYQHVTKTETVTVIGSDTTVDFTLPTNETGTHTLTGIRWERDANGQMTGNEIQMYQYTITVLKDSGQTYYPAASLVQIPGYYLGALSENGFSLSNSSDQEMKVFYLEAVTSIVVTARFNSEIGARLPVSDFMDITLYDCVLGETYSVAAPVISGYLLVPGQPLYKTVIVQDGILNEIAFVYEEIDTAAMTSLLVLKETGGGDIKVIDVSAETTINSTAALLDLTNDWFTLDDTTTASYGVTFPLDVSGGGTWDIYYTKDTTTLTVTAVDGNGNEIDGGAYTVAYSARMGEMETITAPAIPGYDLTEAASKAVYVDQANATATFTYSLLQTDDIIINYLKMDGTQIKTETISGQLVGGTFTFNAPSAFNYGGRKYERDAGTNATVSITVAASGNIINVYYNDVGAESTSSSGSTTTYYALTFAVNGGGSINAVTGRSGTKIDLSNYTPAKDGYSFEGWYSEASLTNKVTTVTLSSNITVYAKWDADETTEDPVALITDDHIAYISGKPGDKVGPDDYMTRAEVMQMFYNLLMSREKGSEVTNFSDVTSGAWYYEAVSTLASLGVINGYADGTFHPDGYVTRAEFCAIASRFDNVLSGTVTFSDISAGYWAYGYIANTVARNWVAGYSDGTFKPDQNITRSEVIKITNAILDRVPDEAYIDSSDNLNKFVDLNKSNWAYYEIIEATNAHGYSINNGVKTWDGLK